MTANELRQKYLEFFKAKGHAIIPSASLIPENDPTTLFVGSGMQSLMPYLLGEKHPEGTRLVNSQKSFRTEDIEEVGDGRHTTMFEMLGNWSLGDYFKKVQLVWIFEFLVKELSLDPNRLYATVFKGNSSIGIEKDKESVIILRDIFKKMGIDAKDVDCSQENGMQDGRIFYYDEIKNWWSRSGMPADMPAGEPGGPDSEIFYDLGANLAKHENSEFKDKPCHVNCDCGRFIEIGNSVFMEYIKTDKGFRPLPQKNVDFGGGLERMTMVAQGRKNVFETDLFINIIKKIEELSGKKYKENTKPFEIIADHIKAATFIIGDEKGIAPSNLGQGYIVRRLIRRAIRYGRQLGIMEQLWTKKVAIIVIDDYKDVYPELQKNVDFIIEQMKEEEEKFSRSLEGGLREYKRGSKAIHESMKKEIIPIRNRVEKISKKSISLRQKQLEAVQKALNKDWPQIKRSLDEAQKTLESTAPIQLEAVQKALNKDWPQIKRSLDEAQKTLESTASIQLEAVQKALKDWPQIKRSLDEAQKTLEPTIQKLQEVYNKKIAHPLFNHYQTYGFPIEMSIEELEKEGLKLEKDILKKEFKKELAKHQELSRTASAGKFKGGLADASEETKKLHTAAHLLLASLRKVLGDHVVQKGSNITAERLRFDFSHGEKMTDEQKQEVEKLVNEAIQRDVLVKCEEMNLDEAKEQNAMGVFESKYGEKVKVYTIGEGNNVFSREICGGPHVEKTGILSKFRIKKEQSSSAGVRRIKAVLE